jgi:hypothetical protein
MGQRSKQQQYWRDYSIKFSLHHQEPVCLMLIYFCIQVEADLANYFYPNMLLVYPKFILILYFIFLV